MNKTTFYSVFPIFASHFLSQMASWAFRAAIIYYIYDTNGGSGSVLGLSIIFSYLPIALGGIFLSKYVDSVQSLRCLSAISLLRGGVILLLILVGMVHEFVTPVAIAVVFLMGLTVPVYSSALARYFRKNKRSEDVPSCIAFVSNIDWLCMILGATAGALLLKATSIGFVLQLACVIYFTTFFVFWRSRGSEQSDETEPASPASGQAFFGHTLIIAVFFLNFGAGIINVYVNVASRNVYALAEQGISVFYMFNGIGAFLGSLLVYFLMNRYKKTDVALIGSVVIALSIFGMGRLDDFHLSVLYSSLMLMFGQVFAIACHSHLLLENSKDVAGKVTGYFTAATFVGVIFNAVMFLILDSLGIEFSLYANASLLVSGVSAILLVAYRYSFSAKFSLPIMEGQDRER
ncbi:MFS transporter [Vibrio sp. S9_S30]|uniref:MFS transporter n=1 Tax=Vibrio sp. S9_S30 TaxID=2720226 RepID=UPI0016805E39|nr:MFS transporter [Vibrio sp. S9_S30]MBD1557786.1 MFS transporter [Vibrio sp. S9_S30]